MTQLLSTRIAALAALGLLIGGAAQAQNLPLPTADSTVDGVTITAPRVVERNRDGVTGQEITMSVRVPFRDLDLKTPQGSAELDARVRKAATYVCTRLSSMYPDGFPDDLGCEKNAVSGAAPQIIKAKNPR
jgi:UrcA family protein